MKTDWLDSGVSGILSRRGSQAGRYGALSLGLAKPATPGPGSAAGRIAAGATSRLATPPLNPSTPPAAPAPPPAAPQQPDFIGDALQGADAAGTAGGIGSNLYTLGRGLLAGTSKLPVANTFLTVMDGIRTPIDLATGADSLEQMSRRDMATLTSRDPGFVNNGLSYLDAAGVNSMRPVASTLALGDAAIEGAGRSLTNTFRAPALDAGLQHHDQRHSAAARALMQQGSASRQQLIDEMARARRERADMQPSGWNPVYWGMGG